MRALVISSAKIPAERRKPSLVLLLDASGSMEEGDPRRIDLLWTAVQALRTEHIPWRTAVFNDRCRWVAPEQKPTPAGMTDLTLAFQTVRTVHPTGVTLVTDGQPNDPSSARQAGIALHCPIHILYVGDPTNDDALDFCRQLCTQTKGTFATEVLTLHTVKTATQTLQKMLVADTTKPSAIVLGGG